MLAARLVRALMDEDAISERKLEAANPLEILGIVVQVPLLCDVMASLSQPLHRSRRMG